MKSSAKKNFMSPTISAVSKAVAQRKKVLVEKNGSEVTEPTCPKFHHRRSSSFDLELPASDDMDAEDGAKLKPYDPVLNYCSLRPKYLYYKPGRMSEILRRCEIIDSTSSESETGSENEKCLVNQTDAGELVDQSDHVGEEAITTKLDEEDGESVMEVEEKIEGLGEEAPEKIGELKAVHERIELLHEAILEEAELVKHQSMGDKPETRSAEQQHQTNESNSEALQIEENDDKRIQLMERFWSYKRFLKAWFVIFSLGLSILYMSSMNSGSVGLEGDHWKNHRSLHGPPFVHENTSGYMIQGELTKMGLEEVSHGMMGEIINGEPDYDIAKFNDGFEEPKYERNSKELDGAVHEKVINLLTADQTEAVEDKMALASNENAVKDIYDAVAGETIAGDAGVIVDEALGPVEEIVSEVIMQLDGLQNEYQGVANEGVDLQIEVSDASSVVMDVFVDANDHTAMTVEETVAFEDAIGEQLEVGDWEVEEHMKSMTESAGDDEINTNLDQNEIPEIVSNPDSVNDGLIKRYAEGNEKAAVFYVVFALLMALFGVVGFQKLRRSTTLKEEVGVAEHDRNQHHVKVDPFVSYSTNIGGRSSLKRSSGKELPTSSIDFITEMMFRNRKKEKLYGRKHKELLVEQEVSSYSSLKRSSGKELPTSSIDSPSYGSFITEIMLPKKESASGDQAGFKVKRRLGHLSDHHRLSQTI